jgi:hypothetical protein
MSVYETLSPETPASWGSMGPSGSHSISSGFVLSFGQRGKSSGAQM